jgi:hypothetical protein
MWWSKRLTRLDDGINQRLWRSETGDIPAAEEIVCRYPGQATVAGESRNLVWLYVTQRGLRIYGERFEPVRVIAWDEIALLDVQLKPQALFRVVLTAGAESITFTLHKQSHDGDLAYHLASVGSDAGVELGPKLTEMI